MLTFTSATLLSQVPGLAGVALAVLGLSLGGSPGGALVGTGLGFALVARPQTAVPAAVALLIWSRCQDRRLLIATVLAGLPWVLAVGIYNAVVMGNPWQLPRAAYAGALEDYGFGTVLRDYSHTPLKALAITGAVLVRLNGWSLGWPASLAGPALWFAMGRPHGTIVGPWGAVALVTFVFQAGYPSAGTSETGAIYHHAALPFIAFATAAALKEAPTLRWGRWIWPFGFASIVLGTTTFYVEHGLRLSRLAAQIEGPRRTRAPGATGLALRRCVAEPPAGGLGLWNPVQRTFPLLGCCALSTSE